MEEEEADKKKKFTGLGELISKAINALVSCWPSSLTFICFCCAVLYLWCYIFGCDTCHVILIKHECYCFFLQIIFEIESPTLVFRYQGPPEIKGNEAPYLRLGSQIRTMLPLNPPFNGQMGMILKE